MVAKTSVVLYITITIIFMVSTPNWKPGLDEDIQFYIDTAGGPDCHRWGNCDDGPGDPGGGGGANDTYQNPQFPLHPHHPDDNQDDDCDPRQTSSKNGCKNCSDVFDECNNFLICCDGLVCGDDWFCSCSNDSKDCGRNVDDNDNADDGTLLDASKIALAVALIIAAVAACVLLWRTFSKYRRRRQQNANPNWQARRRTRQHSSLNSIQRYVLSRLCDRPPRYEDNSYFQQEKPPSYSVAVATIPTPMLTAENAAYIEDETEHLPSATCNPSMQLCPSCLCHCTVAANHAADPEIALHEVSNSHQNVYEVVNSCRTAQSTSVLSLSKAVIEHCCSREHEQHNSELTVACYNPEEPKYVRTESATLGV